MGGVHRSPKPAVRDKDVAPHLREKSSEAPRGGGAEIVCPIDDFLVYRRLRRDADKTVD